MESLRLIIKTRILNGKMCSAFSLQEDKSRITVMLFVDYSLNIGFRHFKY